MGGRGPGGPDHLAAWRTFQERGTLAIIRKIDAQTDSVNARGKWRENMKNAARRGSGPREGQGEGLERHRAAWI